MTGGGGGVGHCHAGRHGQGETPVAVFAPGACNGHQSIAEQRVARRRVAHRGDGRDVDILGGAPASFERGRARSIRRTERSQSVIARESRSAPTAIPASANGERPASRAVPASPRFAVGRPERCWSTCRSVIPPLPFPANCGQYAATGASNSTSPDSTSWNSSTAENFMRSAKAPTISAGVMMAKVIWKAANSVAGIVPLMLSIWIEAKNTLPKSPSHLPCSTPSLPKAMV